MNDKHRSIFKISEMSVLLNAYLYWNYELKNTKTFDNIESTNQMSLYNRSQSNVKGHNQNLSRRKRCAKFMISAEYELIVNLFTITNFGMIVIRMIGLSEQRKFMIKWIKLQTIINFVQLFELIWDLSMKGVIWSYKNTFRVWPETFC